jgi:carotenoid 1,2-hydratase
MIAFVGSVFSPYYASARRRGHADAADHCALNVALYGTGGKRWSMTERGHAQIERSAGAFVLGPSRLEWRADALHVAVDEIAVPVPRKLRGQVIVHPQSKPDFALSLDTPQRHHWSPIAPCARIEVDFESPRVSWRGTAYLDCNSGTVPLESSFRSWHWSRSHDGSGSTHVTYDVERREEAPLTLGLRIGPDGRVEPAPLAPEQRLRRTLWGVDRRIRNDGHGGTRVTTLEDTPFYARSLVRPAGQPVMVHETLSLERFDTRWVQALLPFRMPRRGSGRAV